MNNQISLNGYFLFKYSLPIGNEDSDKSFNY